MSLDEHSFIFAIPGGKKPSTARKRHICRLYDVLQTCLLRDDLERARRAWSILVRCPEIDWKIMWRIGLVLIKGRDNTDSSVQETECSEYLATMMLQYPEARESLIQETVLRLIKADRCRKALEELELYLPSPPYQDNPTLHVYAGLICIYLAQPDTLDSAEDIELVWNDGLLRQAQQYLERARSLDPNEAVAEAWLTKIPSLSQSARLRRDDSPDSDDDAMTVDKTQADHNHKRAKTASI